MNTNATMAAQTNFVLGLTATTPGSPTGPPLADSTLTYVLDSKNVNRVRRGGDRSTIRSFSPTRRSLIGYSSTALYPTNARHPAVAPSFQTVSQTVSQTVFRPSSPLHGAWAVRDNSYIVERECFHTRRLSVRAVCPLGPHVGTCCRPGQPSSADDEVHHDARLHRQTAGIRVRTSAEA